MPPARATIPRSCSPQNDARGIRCGQCRLRPGADPIAFESGRHAVDLEHDLVRLQRIGGDEIDARLRQTAHELHVPGEPVEVRDQEGGTESSALIERHPQLGHASSAPTHKDRWAPSSLPNVDAQVGASITVHSVESPRTRQPEPRSLVIRINGA